MEGGNACATGVGGEGQGCGVAAEGREHGLPQGAQGQDPGDPPARTRSPPSREEMGFIFY